MKEKAVLIFGSFNPITNAHINMAETSKKMIPDADIIFIPAKEDFLRSWKRFDDSSILKERVPLIKKVAERYGYTVSEIETKGIVDGKTVNTISYLKEHEGYGTVYLCMGTDKVNEIGTWYKGEELLRDNRFIILMRDEHTDDILNAQSALYKDNFIFVREESSFMEISSTAVRNYLNEGNLEAIKDLVPEEVYDLYSKEANR